ncbi:Fungalysin/Thermolysin Extracellular metalloproteinase 5, partial [Physocladia obscura]
GADVTVTDVYTSSHTNVIHIFLVQLVNGLEVENAVANVLIDRKNGDIISFVDSFTTATKLKPSGKNKNKNKNSESSGGKVKALPANSPFSLNDLYGQHHKEQEHTTKLQSLADADPLANLELADPLEALDFLFAELGIHPSSSFATIAPFSQSSNSFSHSASSSSNNGLRNNYRLVPDFEISLLMKTNTRHHSRRATDAKRVKDDISTLSIPATLKYYLVDDEYTLIPVWDFELDLGNHWYHAHVDARKSSMTIADVKKTVALVDWVSEGYFESDNLDGYYERVPVALKPAKKQVSKNGTKNFEKKKSSKNTSLSVKGIYNVYPLGINDPFDGERNLVAGPLSLIASPKGWHFCGGGKAKCLKGNYTVTAGNNVFAQENLDGGYNGWENKSRPDGTSKLIFDSPVDLLEDPETYIDAAVINLFFWNNAIHDLFYVYGFTEAAGNFQDSNLNRGGAGGDSVIANAQDGSGHNNANFATPPDGTHGRMRMYVWDVVDPWRDGDLEGGIIMHEYAHGISTRLTGGPANSGCLGWGESGGMGEGWGDFFATITRTTANTTREQDFGMGEYSNGGKGIRKFKYSTSLDTNPSVYSTIQKPGYWGVHAKGEVWAAILYEVYWNIVDAHGFNPDWFDTSITRIETVNNGATSEFSSFTEFSTGKVRARTGIVFPAGENAKSEDPYEFGGNVLALQLVVDGLKLQPCSPSFVDARDAIILAEEILTGGQNKCLLWKGFAKRGLGVGAKDGGRDGYGVPEECE